MINDRNIFSKMSLWKILYAVSYHDNLIRKMFLRQNQLMKCLILYRLFIVIKCQAPLYHCIHWKFYKNHQYTMNKNVNSNDNSIMELGMIMIGCNDICISSQRRKFHAFFGSHVAATACWILMKEQYPSLSLLKKNMLFALYHLKKILQMMWLQISLNIIFKHILQLETIMLSLYVTFQW